MRGVFLQLAIFVAVICVSVRGETPGLERSGTELVRSVDDIAWTALKLAPLDRSERLAELRWHVSALNPLRRWAAAFLLNPEDAEENALLQVLLQKDVLPVIRRTAAQTLFGNAADGREHAVKYAYLDVTEAEVEVRDLVKTLPAMKLSEQYAITRKLIGLGPHALYELRKSAVDPNPVISLSSIFAVREILQILESSDPFVPDSFNRRLEKKVEFEMVDTPLLEGLRCLTHITGVSLKEVPGETRQNYPINLRVTQLSLRTSAFWIGKLTETEIAFVGEEILFRQSTALSNAAIELTDARDLVELVGEATVLNEQKNDRFLKAPWAIEHGFLIGKGNANTANYSSMRHLLAALRKKHGLEK